MAPSTLLGDTMTLNLKVLALATIALCSLDTKAQEFDNDYFTISRMEVREITQDVFGLNSYQVIREKNLQEAPPVDPIEKAGKVIAVARDLVALGEDVYKLVIKGKPTNTTTYAPITVVPKVNGEPVDPLEIENTRMPVKKTYEVVYENLYGIDVVTFRYSIMWAYGGSYDGKGAYLSHIQIIPEFVRTLFGYDFTATMKLGGIQNMSTRANPVAGATILLEYTVSTVMVANNETEQFFVNGVGGYKKY